MRLVGGRSAGVLMDIRRRAGLGAPAKGIAPESRRYRSNHMLVALTHHTRYHYDRMVNLGPQVVRLRPAPHCRTPIVSYSLNVLPSNHYINWQQDPFSNYLARYVFQEPTRDLEISVDLTARMEAIDPFDFFLESQAEHWPFSYDAEAKKDLVPFLEEEPQGELFNRLLEAIPRNRKRTVDFLVELNQLVESEIGYLIRMEPGVQSPEETLRKKSGSCRDSGWLLVQILRHIGLAARFVSGYLIQLKADEIPLDGPPGPSADFTDLHAWAEVYVPGAGWIGLDPTSGLLAGEGHIPLAATPFPRGASPITGALDPCEVEFDFEMHIRRIEETPRVSKPFTPDQWSRIDQTGETIDGKLLAGDVRLTMGGEPTFVSAIDRDAPEWDIEAVGPTKRGYADRLIRRLRERFAPGGMLHYGQGKWYPGEQLPRWSFSLYWRKDEEPLWRNPDLIARERVETPATIKDAERFMDALCENLDIDSGFAQPGYEDPVEYLMQERKLAPNVDVLDNRLEDPMERDRIARVFERGLTRPKCIVLPIQAAQMKDSRNRRRRFRWASERWTTRRGRLYLIPGDSPGGFRLPLRSLRYLSATDYPHIYPQDPFSHRSNLPRREPLRQSGGGPLDGVEAAGVTDQTPDMPAGVAELTSRRADADDEPDLRPMEPDLSPMEDVTPGGTFVGAGPAIRTALAIEPRDGHLCIFIPPVHSADEFVDLVYAIEDTATRLGVPVHLEGYPPPPDDRLKVIKVTPDPGVIEVNVHPGATWQEQKEITEILYEEARRCNLDASNFSVDGRPTGSGGGNHIVVGAAHPEDSPFLRRPDLLGSIIRFWQNHPSLNYLFSGLFIGPTSQAPRLDEGRHDALHEMEIALDQVPDPETAGGAWCPPWLVDRLFRNLLVDVSGNTHRAEICIDKLYSPDGPAGRLGLVEFRAFEMPPHPKMSLLQQLLIRSLIAWFWETPYKRPLIRFGTALHDRYMLPHFIWRDFKSVVRDLSDALQMHFDADWFLPQFEFRFPLIGRVRYENLEIELRTALEPWPVLGEENVVGGTARFVDASMERLQVRLTGEIGDRHKLACNGIEVPLQPTERHDELVAGVRYRSWLPGYCLHPTIPAHAPLVFDLFDTWNGRSCGGCTYFWEHPGGRNPEHKPVNASEAEGRRRARFQPFGHTPGPYQMRAWEPHPEFPLTLDMRRT